MMQLDSMKAALAMFKDFPCKRRFALLGDMLELGDISRAAHEAAKTEARNSTGDIETRLAGLSSAVTAYKSATSDIQMPESGKAYTIANIIFSLDCLIRG